MTLDYEGIRDRIRDLNDLLLALFEAKACPEHGHAHIAICEYCKVTRCTRCALPPACQCQNDE